MAIKSNEILSVEGYLNKIRPYFINNNLKNQYHKYHK